MRGPEALFDFGALPKVVPGNAAVGVSAVVPEVDRRVLVERPEGGDQLATVMVLRIWSGA